MFLQRIQHDIERLYGLQGHPDISDYICAQPLESDSAAGLYLEIEGDTIEAKIFFKKDIFDFISSCEKKEIPMDKKNIMYYMAAVEEVSHLIYLWNRCVNENRHPETMTKLEMELQANVDKYIVLAEIFIRQTSRYPANLREVIFEKIRCNGGYNKEIYDFCDDMAIIYSNRLEKLILNRNKGEFLEDVRKFYRKGHHEKLRHILS